MATLIGDGNPNIIDGTDAADVIVSLDGNDTVAGGAGGDFIVGGTGDDVIDGGAGDDWIYAEGGNDVVDGGDGGDVIVAGDGADFVDGGDGTDLIVVGDGDDTIIGGAGGDAILGDAGIDTARFAGDARDYRAFLAGDFGWEFAVLRLSTGEVDWLSGVEILEFDNGTFHLDGRNNAPIADDVAASVGEDAAPLDLDLLSLSDAFDFEGEALSIASVETNAQLSFDPVTGIATYDVGDAFQTLGAGEIATESFEFAITDGTNTTTRTLSVTIEGANDAPVVAGPVAAAVNEDGPAVLVDLLAGASDVDAGTELAITGLEALPPGLGLEPDGHTVAVDPGDAAFQALALGEVREIALAYTIVDGDGGAIPQTATITVNGVNDAPSLAAASAAALEDGPAVEVDLAPLGSDVDSDDDGASLAYAIVGGPAEGTAAIAGTTLTFDPGAGFQDLAAGDSRAVTVSVAATDRHGALSSAADVTVTVTGVNDAPDAVADAAATGAETAVAIAVLANDGDVDAGDAPRLAAVDDARTQGTVMRIGDEVTYDPAGAFESLAAGETATDTFIYTVSDGNGGTDTATVTVTIEGVNDAPVAEDDTAFTLNDIAVTVDVLANDTDAEGDPLTITAIDDSASLGSVTITNGGADVEYNANGLFNTLGFGETGTDTFTYTVSDGLGGTDTATATVTLERWAIDLSSLVGANGFRLTGESGLAAGYSVSGAGDVNGDGFDDVIIGAYQASPDGVNRAGASYVVFGKAGGFDPVIDLTGLDGTDGFRLDGNVSQDRSGSSVSSAGDVNGDGIDDLIIGAEGSGEAYVVFGSASGFDASLDLSDLADGTNGFSLEGIDRGGQGTHWASPAGDINGDGIDDVIVGSELADSRAGESYVVYGQPDRVDFTFGGNAGASLNVSLLGSASGSEEFGLVLRGINASDESGFSVSGAGDVNGDGIDDFIIGANLADEAYVVFGRSGGFDATFDLSSLDGSNGFRLDGFDSFLVAVSEAGDVNGDGVDDLMVGANSADSNGTSSAGETYVVFGRNVDEVGDFDAALDVSGLDGTNGLSLAGIDAGDQSGFSVSSAGDVNGDGIDDLIIGAYTADPGGSNIAGESYVVFGSGAGFTSKIDLASLDGMSGFRLDGIEGNDQSGHAVSSAGDVNGDGFNDLIVGNKFDGQSFVVFGEDFLGIVDQLGDDGDNVLTAGGGGEILIGAQGNDVLVGGAGGDLLNGASGDDTLAGGPSDDSLIGGSGFDRAEISGSGADTTITTVGARTTLSGPDGTDVLTEVEAIQFDDATYLVEEGTFAPVAQDDAVSGDEDTEISGNVLANDSDLGGDLLTVSAFDAMSAMGATLVVLEDGTFAYDPTGVDALQALAKGETATDTFGYTISDGNGGTDTATATVTISGVNDAPVADNLTFSITESEVLSGTVTSSDVDGTLVTYSLVDGPAAGVLAFNDDGTFVFDPGTDLVGLLPGETEDFTFTYTAADAFGSESEVAITTITATGTISAAYDLDDLQRIGFTLSGLDAGSGTADDTGWSVSTAGDQNSDGYDDIVIGAPFTEATDLDRPQAYIFFGAPDIETGSLLELTALGGSDGFIIEEDGELTALFGFGYSVSGGGDFDGDGVPDVLIGWPFFSTAHLHFGDASAGREIEIEETSFDVTGSGRSVDLTGDVNGDGFDDAVISNPLSASPVEVVFGAESGVPTNVEQLDGSNGFTLGVTSRLGTINDQYAGDALTVVDINGDGFDELIVGAPLGEVSPLGEDDRGVVYIVDGRSNFSTLNDADIEDAADATLRGADADDLLGSALGAIGDFNGDGFNDFIIGAPGADGGGKAYVVFGSQGVASGAVDSTSFVSIEGASDGDELGFSVAGAGDVNGDGLDDVIVGTYVSKAYVIFGQAGLSGGVIDVAGLDGTEGFLLSGTRKAGRSVSSAGDMDRDGFDDVILGAPGVEFGSGQDRVHVVFGGNLNDAIDVVGTENNDDLSGTSASETINGFDGDDTLVGEEGDDFVVGGFGDDLIIGSGGEDYLVGGEGADLFTFFAGDFTGSSDRDIVRDFSPGEDRIVLYGWDLTFADLDVDGSGVVDADDNPALNFFSDTGGVVFAIDSTLSGFDIVGFSGVSELAESDFSFL